MKKILIVIMTLSLALTAAADTVLVFGFDNNDEPNGIQYLGADQLITFSGAVSGSGQTDFNLLDGVSAPVTFSIGAVGDLPSFSGTMTPVGGAFDIGGNGGGVDGESDTYVYFESGEAWEFTFSKNVILTAIDYWGPDVNQQTILVDGTPVSGSPFTADFSGSISILSGEVLTFGHAGTAGNYVLDTFTVTVVPEPATFAMLGIGGLLVAAVRRRIC
jgi:hypothetical protein